MQDLMCPRKPRVFWATSEGILKSKETLACVPCQTDLAPLRREFPRGWHHFVRQQHQRRHAEEGAERLLTQARAEMRQMGTGRRAHRGYQAASPDQSRLFDGTR